MTVKAAIWARVSTEDQDCENQIRELRAFAERRGLNVVKVYTVEESAWKGAHRRALETMIADAGAGNFDVLLTWSLDRLDRRGPLPVLQLIDRLAKLGVTVASHQESWVETSGELQPLLISLVAWIAAWESRRRSERTKAGLARAVAEGRRLGRPPGAKDRKKRRRTGYLLRWADRAAR